MIDHQWVSRGGIIATLVGSAGALAFVVVAGFALATMGLTVLLCAAAVAAALIAGRHFRRHPYEDVEPALLAWGTVDSILIGAAVVITGGAWSPIGTFAVLPVVFFVPLLSRRRQVVMTAVAAATVVIAELLAAGPIDVAGLAVIVSLIATGAITSVHLARLLVEQREAHLATELVAERRAQLLALASMSARSLTTLESGEVLDNLLEAATRLGIDTAAVFTLDQDGERATCVREAGTVRVWEGRSQSLDVGLVGLALTTGRTQAAADYAASPHAVDDIVAHGIRSVAAFPVTLHDASSIVLCIGSRTIREFASEEIEAFELLALHAGQALHNARRYERERDARAKLEELDRLQEEFVATASHELRTPLTVISGFSQTLTTRWESIADDQRRQYLDRIRRHADDLTRLVEQLTRFHQLDVGDIDFDPRLSPIRMIVEDAIARMDESRRAEVALTTVIEPHDVEVWADPRLLSTAIHALLDNVVQHTPVGTSVTVRARLESGHVHVEVADDGPGMSDVELPRALVDFVRGGEYLTRGTRGIGLGLPTVRRILALHESQLHIESDLGGGTTCRFGIRSAPRGRRGRRLPASNVVRLGAPAVPVATSSRAEVPMDPQ